MYVTKRALRDDIKTVDNIDIVMVFVAELFSSDFFFVADDDDDDTDMTYANFVMVTVVGCWVVTDNVVATVVGIVGCWVVSWSKDLPVFVVSCSKLNETSETL